MSARPEPAPISLISGVRRLDARLGRPAGAPRAALVVAHPHPAHGGHMDHPVVVFAAETAAALGLLALRFDFGGVRGSEGAVDDLAAHRDDWRAAAAEAARRAPGVPLLGAGFSYGARCLAWLVGPAARPRLALQGHLLLAPATRVPATRRDFGALLLGRPLSEAARDAQVLANLAALPPPVEVLVGSKDGVAPPAELAAHLPAHARLTVLDGLNHFFHRGPGAGAPERAVLGPALEAALGRLLGAPPADQEGRSMRVTRSQ